MTIKNNINVVYEDVASTLTVYSCALWAQAGMVGVTPLTQGSVSVDMHLGDYSVKLYTNKTSLTRFQAVSVYRDTQQRALMLLMDTYPTQRWGTLSFSGLFVHFFLFNSKIDVSFFLLNGHDLFFLQLVLFMIFVPDHKETARPRICLSRVTWIWMQSNSLQLLNSHRLILNESLHSYFCLTQWFMALTSVVAVSMCMSCHFVWTFCGSCLPGIWFNTV